MCPCGSALWPLVSGPTKQPHTDNTWSPASHTGVPSFCMTQRGEAAGRAFQATWDFKDPVWTFLSKVNPNPESAFHGPLPSILQGLSEVVPQLAPGRAHGFQTHKQEFPAAFISSVP